MWFSDSFFWKVPYSTFPSVYLFTHLSIFWNIIWMTSCMKGWLSQICLSFKFPRHFIRISYGGFTHYLDYSSTDRYSQSYYVLSSNSCWVLSKYLLRYFFQAVDPVYIHVELVILNNIFYVKLQKSNIHCGESIQSCLKLYLINYIFCQVS